MQSIDLHDDVYSETTDEGFILIVTNPGFLLEAAILHTKQNCLKRYGIKKVNKNNQKHSVSADLPEEAQMRRCFEGNERIIFS